METNTLASASEQAKQDRIKALVAIFTTSFMVGLAFGAAMPMVSMSMELRGMSAADIGYVTAAAPIALLLVSPMVSTIVRRFGLLGSMMLGFGIIVISFWMMPSFFGVLPWFLLRLFAGIGICITWILSETWVNSIATNENRGKIIASFMLVMSFGFGLGPIAVEQIGVESWTSFYAAGGMVLISIIPLIWARGVVPIMEESTKGSFLRTFRLAPLILAAALLAGMTDATQISFFPVYAVRMGLDTSIALYMLTVIVMGNFIIQVPLGIYSDRMERRTILIILLFLCFVTGIGLPFSLDSIFIWPLLAIWGGAAFGLYTIALIIIGDRFKGGEMAGANAAFVSVFECGSVAGPVIVGHSMDAWGPIGMPVILVTACVPLLILAVWRSMTHYNK